MELQVVRPFSGKIFLPPLLTQRCHEPNAIHRRVVSTESAVQDRDSTAGLVYFLCVGYLTGGIYLMFKCMEESP